MKIFAYQSFRDFYQKLPTHIQKKTDKSLKLLAHNSRHPSLHVKKIQGTGSLWEARVDRHYRLSFEMTADTVHLRAVGNHDEVLRHP